MSTSVTEQASGHVFISYVREDADQVDRLQATLEAAGIRVWRDTEDLWPGQDWKSEIRKAITSNSLVFIACFSRHSQNRDISYQNEELTLAAEQMRLRPPGKSWLVPARFDDCAVPEFELGAGRTLNSIQRIDLFGDARESNLARLISTVLKILGSDSPRIDVDTRKNPRTTPRENVYAFTKGVLLAPERQIELEDLVTDTVRSTRASLQDESTFPLVMPAGANSYADNIRYIVSRTRKYVEVIQPLAKLLIAGCTWGRPQHDALWARSIQGVANAARWTGGNSALISLQRYPALYLLYAAGIGAAHRDNYGALRALTLDAKFRAPEGRDAMINKLHPEKVFEGQEIAANVLAIEADGKEVTDDDINSLRTGHKGRRYTPVSDYLYSSIKELYDEFIFDDEEYTETFDKLEIIVGLIATDEKLQAKAAGRYVYGPWYGAFTWRNQWSDTHIEVQISERLVNQGERSSVLQAGLFGGSPERMTHAIETFIDSAAKSRQSRW